jgi:ketosteroid isomerase-like protein/catechol 2,3-dioxygenase-like lactoylglutathione lyase family enzyme
MTSNNERLAREGYEALIKGDLERLEELFAPDVQWYGQQPGPGDCLNREEALAVIRQRALERAIGELREVSALDGDRVLVVMGPPGLSAMELEELGIAAGQEVASIVTFDGGKVVAMQDYRSRSEALAPPLAPTGRDWRVRGLVPFAHVADVRRSIAFYVELGFAVRETYAPEGQVVWAHLASKSAQLMLAQADGPIERDRHAVLFYLYSEDLRALRDRLIAAGSPVSAIVDGRPGPRHEMRVTDPDGYCLMVAQLET